MGRSGNRRHYFLMPFAKFIMKAFGAKPVMLIPSQCAKAVKAISHVLDFEITDDIDDNSENTVTYIVFTKEREEAPIQAKRYFPTESPAPP